MFRGNSIWLADDVTLIANSEESLKKNIKILEKAGKKHGLIINEEKSKVVHIRGTEQHKQIGNFEVVNSVK